MSDYTLPHYCNVCHEVGEPEVVLEFAAGDCIEFKHCSFCGSDRVTPVDEMADGMNMEDDR